MPIIDILWDLPDDPDGNVQHIAEHGLVPADVEFVVQHPLKRSQSRSSGLPLVSGRLTSGEQVVVVYQMLDELTMYPVTAYCVEE